MKFLKMLFCTRYRRENEELKTRISELENVNTKLKETNVKYEKDIKYYLERIDSLNRIISLSISVPQINITENDIIEWKYYNDLRFSGYNVVYADNSYYELSFVKFKEVLDKVYENFRKVHPYIPEVWDCDDFALFYAGILGYTAKMCGLKKQLAFGIAWSNNHAFNVFLADGEVWVYEPQNNDIVGKMKDMDGTYKVSKVWFLS